MKVSRLVVTHPDGHARQSVSLSELLLAPAFDWDRRLRYLYAALARYVPEIDVIPSGNLGTWERWVAAAGSFDPSRDAWSERFHKNAFAFARKSLRSEKDIAKLGRRPDLVFHIQGVFSPQWRTRDLPYVMYLDFSMALSERDWPAWAPFRTRRAQASWRACEQRAYSHAAHIFTWSDYARRSLVDDYGIAADRVTTVGAAGNFDSPSDRPRVFGGRTLLFMSSNFARKGGDLLFAAFAQVRRSRPDLRLLVLGQPIPSCPPGVEYLGYLSRRDDVIDVFHRADLLVLPSRCEPYGMALVEAMNQGLPCIVSNTGGMPEIVEHGRTGLIVENEDPEQLAAAIVRLLDSPTEWWAMSQAGRDRVTTRLNWNAIAARMWEIIKTL
jgi:glycosyltransferase involved in cell wall biosynthesis